MFASKFLKKHLFQAVKPFMLSSGESLERLQCVYELYGKINKNKDNVILINHALSTSSHLASHPGNHSPGWWQNMVGPNLPIDTNKYFVVCINNLGSCYGSTGPLSINPRTGLPYKSTFPRIEIQDIAKSQYLVLKSLDIKRCHAVIGPSMGGMISLSMAALYPGMMKNLLLISTSQKSYPYNIAIRNIQIEIMNYVDSKYPDLKKNKDLSAQGFQISRKLSHILYKTPESLNKKFKNSDKNNIVNYLNYNAQKFTRNFDIYSYLLLNQAMNNFDVRKIAPNKSYKDIYKKISAKTKIISVNSDLLFPPEQQVDIYREMINAGVDVHYTVSSCEHGHDSFLIDSKIEEEISTFLKNKSEKLVYRR